MLGDDSLAIRFIWAKYGNVVISNPKLSSVRHFAILNEKGRFLCKRCGGWREGVGAGLSLGGESIFLGKKRS